MTTEKKIIACLGSGEGKPGDPMYDAMQEVGRLLAERGHTVATGGFGGIGMEAPCRGAHTAGGHTIGYTFGRKHANEFVAEVVPCNSAKYGTVSARGIHEPTIEVQYGIRLGHLLTADAFVIAATNDLGTMVEFLAILNLAVKVWKEPKRVALLFDDRAKSLEGRILDDFASQRDAIPAKVFRSFRFVRIPADVVSWVTGETPLSTAL